MGDGAATNAALRAHEDIRTAILSGQFAAGSMLSESNLAAAMSMSRTPVRAALARLQAEGLVTIYPQRGALVRELTADEVRESAQVRHALELAGVQLADANKRAGLRKALAPNLAEQEACLRGSDVAAFAALAMQFHRSFVELAGNETMLAFYGRLQDRQYLSILRSPAIGDDPARVVSEHHQLLTDAEVGDWISFSAHLREHQTNNHDVE
jgi:DNA-binding GntR family transcriptional regulator